MHERSTATGGRERRLSPSLIAAVMISVFALTVALSSTATAAYMVGSAQIKKKAVKAKHIKPNAIKERHLSPAARAALAGTGPQGAQGPQGIQGEPGVSERTVVQAIHTIATGNASGVQFSAPVTCPVGLEPFGGGYTTNGSTDLVFTMDRPNSVGNSWTFAGKNYGPGVVITTYAVCAKVG